VVEIKDSVAGFGWLKNPLRSPCILEQARVDTKYNDILKGNPERSEPSEECLIFYRSTPSTNIPRTTAFSHMYIYIHPY